MRCASSPGTYGHRDVNERAARRLREHTGGSPLHLRALLREGRLPGGGWLSAPLPAPLPFARLVATQLGRLSPPARDLARAAAVLGLRSDLCAAAEMARVADPLAAADELRTAQIAGVERTPRGVELVFDHSVIRAAVLQDCGEADLAAAHRAAAEVSAAAIEALNHLAKATVGYDLDLADRLAEQARDDIARGGWRTAADALMEASRLHPDPLGARRAAGRWRVRAAGGRRPRRRRGLPRPGGRRSAHGPETADAGVDGLDVR